MNKKKCLNCLCMVDINVKICPFCKTSFKEVKAINIPKRKFVPPVLGVTNKEITTFNNDLDDDNKRKENNNSKFKELIVFIINKKNNEFPYFIPNFEIESLEIADIKDYEEKDKKTFENPESISVDESSLQEINQLASLFVKEEKLNKDQEIQEIKDKEDILPETKFSSKNILRTETKDIKDKKNEDEPILNIKNLIISLDELTNKENIDNKESINSNLENIIKKIELKNKNKGVFDIKDLTIEKQENNKEIIYQARSSDNQLALNHYNLAKDLCVKRDYIKALIELENAVNIDPRFEQAHILLSRTYIKLKKDGLINVKE